MTAEFHEGVRSPPYREAADLPLEAGASASMAAAGSPDAEIEIGVTEVRALLEEQHEDLAHLPIRPVASGWDNAMFRLGEDLAVRLPRRGLAAELVEHEQQWLPGLASHLPLPIPVPIRTGRPSRRAGERPYPWSWSIVPWLPGRPADSEPIQADQAETLADFLAALHRLPAAGAPENSYRGVPLGSRAPQLRQRMDRLEQHGEALWKRYGRRLRDFFEEAVETKNEDAPALLHGDLHARNVLVGRGELRAIIDWGDITAGDRATDLASAWTLLPDRGSRARMLETYADASPETWLRALGWAVFFGVVFLDSGSIDCPRHARMGERTLVAVVEDLERIRSRGR